MHGYGVKKIADGTIYDGNWVENMFVEGKLNYPDGKIFEGKFKDNKPFGYGVRSWPDGKKYEGYWTD